MLVIFDWDKVAWGKPDSPRRPLCAYCHGLIAEDDVPLVFFRDEGSCAQFCDKCEPLVLAAVRLNQERS